MPGLGGFLAGDHAYYSWENCRLHRRLSTFLCGGLAPGTLRFNIMISRDQMLPIDKCLPIILFLPRNPWGKSFGVVPPLRSSTIGVRLFLPFAEKQFFDRSETPTGGEEHQHIEKYRSHNLCVREGEGQQEDLQSEFCHNRDRS